LWPTHTTDCRRTTRAASSRWPTARPTPRSVSSSAKGSTTQVLLVRRDGEVDAWRNVCPHWTDVRLHSGSGAECRAGEILCTRHGATVEPGSGECTHGPCEGAYLEAVEVTVTEGAVYLTDEDYEFEGLGPKSDRDLSSGRIGFGGS
jgi:nitrite reductase/ring-hydroxylating ferredoxin subunit